MIVKIGHRGACGYEPENTLLSFKKALELNVDMIELDVYACKTGELVVIHDDKVNRTTNGKGHIIKKSFKELRELNAGKGEKIPTLHEVLDLINQKAKVNIELKGTGTVKPVYEVIEKYVKEKDWSYNDFLISSFNHYELLKFIKLCSNVKIGVLIKGIPIGFVEFAEKVNAYSVNLSLESVSKEFVEHAHKRGMKVFVYTVNNVDDMQRMKVMGVDGVFSDFPDRI